MSKKFIWEKVNTHTDIESLVPGVREGFKIAITNSTLILFGGSTRRQEITSDLLMMDLLQMKKMWQDVPTNGELKPVPRRGHAMCTYGRNIVVFGGTTGSEHLNDLWVLNTVHLKKANYKKIWRFLSSSGVYHPKGRESHCITVIQSTLFLLGGT